MLDKVMAQYKSQKITIVIGDQNTKIAKERDDEIIGKFRQGTCNECRET